MKHLLVYRSRRATPSNLIEALESGAGPGWSATIVDTTVAMVAAFDQRRPDIALVGLDVEDPSGMIRLLRRIDASVAVLAVGGGDHPDRVAAAILAGARGYIRDESFAATVANQAFRPASGQAAESAEIVGLSEREMQVLVGMSDGKSNAEIGRELYVTEDTVKTHARRLFRKIGAVDRAGAVANGFRRRLLT